MFNTLLLSAPDGAKIAAHRHLLLALGHRRGLLAVRVCLRALFLRTFVTQLSLGFESLVNSVRTRFGTG